MTGHSTLGASSSLSTFSIFVSRHFNIKIIEMIIHHHHQRRDVGWVGLKFLQYVTIVPWSFADFAFLLPIKVWNVIHLVEWIRRHVWRLLPSLLFQKLPCLRHLIWVGDFTLESVMKEEEKTIYQKLEILASQKDFHNKFLDVKFFYAPSAKWSFRLSRLFAYDFLAFMRFVVINRCTSTKEIFSSEMSHFTTEHIFIWP